MARLQTTWPTTSPCRSATRVRASRTSPSARSRSRMRVSSECSAPVGHPERQVVQRPGGLEVVRALAAQDEVTVHGVILSAGRRRARASTARSRKARPSRSTSTTSSATSSPSPATSRRAAQQGRAPRARTTPRAARRARSAERAAASAGGAYSGALEACTRKSGPLSTSRSTTSHGPRGRAAAGEHVEHVGDVQGAPLPLDARAARATSPARAQPTSGAASSTTSTCAHPRVREHRAGRHPQAEPADEHPPRRRVPPQGPLGEGHLGAGVDGVHREGAVDDELEHRTTAAQRHLAVRGVGARDASPPRRRRRGRRHGTDAGHAATVRTANGRVRAVVNHRHTRPFVRGAVDRQRRSRPSSLSSRRTASPEPRPEGGVV